MDVMPVEADNTDLLQSEENAEENHVSDHISGNNCHGEDGIFGATKGGGVAAEGPSMTQVMEKWELQLASKSPETRNCYRRHIRRLLASCGKRSPNTLTDEDIARYLNRLKSRSGQDQAMAAIKSFMKVCGRTIGDISRIPTIPSRPIQEINDEQFRKILEATQDMRERVLMMVLWDTGGRISAICNIEVDDFRGDHIILRSELAKNKVESLAPISEETSKAIKEYIIKNRPCRYVFETSTGRPLNRRKAYGVIKRAAKKAGISTRVYPHLFRHMRALAYRRANTEPDVVVNAMGWTDTSQYNKRYGRRTAVETLEEAKKALSSHARPDGKVEVVERLTALLETGKIDINTFQAGLKAIGGGKREPDPDLKGYQ